MLSATFSTPFDRELTEEELISAVSTIYEIDPTKIIVRYSEDDESNITDDTIGICTIRRSKGEYPIWLQIIMVRGYYNRDEELKVIESLCDILKCSALFDNATLEDYFTLLKISGTIQRQRVKVDPASYDNGEVYIIE